MTSLLLLLKNKNLAKMKFNYNDGGRAAAGYKGHTGDCVCRAVAIASGRPYQEVYDRLAEGNASQKLTRNESRVLQMNTAKAKRAKKRIKVKTAEHGIKVKRKWFQNYMKELGFSWVPTMFVGEGCKVHLRDGELPMGRLIVTVSKHYTAVIDGVINDTYNPDRNEYRCVYGYFIKK